MTRKWMLISVLLLTVLLVWLERRENTQPPVAKNLQAAVKPPRGNPVDGTGFQCNSP